MATQKTILLVLYDILQTRQEHILRIVQSIHCNIVCSNMQKGAILGETTLISKQG